MVLEGREKSAARSCVAGILPTRALTLVHPTAYKEAFSEGGFKEHTLGEVAGRVTRFASKVRVYGQQRRSTIALLRHRAAFALRRSGVRFPSTPRSEERRVGERV